MCRINTLFKDKVSSKYCIKLLSSFKCEGPTSEMAVQRTHKHIRELEYKSLRKKTLSLPRFRPVEVSVT